MTEQPIIPEPTPRTIGQYLPIIFVLLIAAWLRIAGAAYFPVSTDEGWSTWAISEPGFSAIVDKLATDRHPPLYFLAIGYWSRIAGDSHLALRLPNILIGVLAAAIVFRIGADTFGRTAKPGREDVSWYGMLMYAVLPVAVYYSQEVRHFGWFVASVCWSSLLFVRVLRGPRLWLIAAYGLSVAAMMYILYFGIWVVLVQVLVGLILWRGDASINWRTTPKDKARLIFAWAGALVLYIPWLIVIIRQQLGILGPGITAAPGTFLSTLPDLLRLLDLLMGGGLALTLGLWVVGFWGTLVSDRTDVTLGLRFANPAWLAELYVMIWGMGLFLLLAIINNFTGVLSARTMIFVSPAFMLVIGAGIVRQRLGVRWSLLGAYIAVSVMLPPLIQPRLDYDVAANTLRDHYSPGDLIVLETGWDDNAFRYEIRQALGPDATIIRTLPWVNNRDPNLPVVPQIEDDLSEARRIWVVQWHQPSQVIPWLDEGEAGFELIGEYRTFVGEEYAGRYRAFGASDEVLLALYARPEISDTSAVFDEQFVLTDVLYPEAVKRGTSIHVDAWWSAEMPVELDYSVGLFLMGENETIISEYNDAIASEPSSAWLTDGTLYHGGYTLSVPRRLAPGNYDLLLSVYYFESPDTPLLVEGEPRLHLGEITVR